jgi:hypothetical protein
MESMLFASKLDQEEAIVARTLKPPTTLHVLMISTTESPCVE